MFQVVVIEDEEIIRRGLIQTTPWSDLGLEVIGEADHGLAGISLIESLHPDIIITDIRMPHMDGIEMLKTLDLPYQPAVIVISAHRDFDYAQNALQYGAVDYLVKPFDDHDFQRAVDLSKEFLELQNNKIKTDHAIKNSYDDNLRKAMSYVLEHYHEDISVAHVASYCGVSSSYLSRLFKNESQMTFLTYLTSVRLDAACELLKNPHIRIYEVANQVGFKDQRYFSVVFKKHLGISPLEFRERVEK